MHELFMRRCFDLAVLGRATVAPNPMVGAVIVHQNRIIGEGWHQQYGGPHAEVHAIRSAPQHLLDKSTLYCSLEPCHHYGKTPPCVDLIIAHKIPRVVIANTDPNPLVSGQSIHKMRDLGIEVITGVLEEEGKWLNRTFFTWITQKRPYILLKWAQSADGYLGKQGERTAITGPVTRRLVHRWRTEVDAILVGTQTALVDNPQLDSRYYPGKNPLRIVPDFDQKIPDSAHLLDDSMPTWILGPQRAGTWKHTDFVSLSKETMLKELLTALSLHKKATLLVEGGASMLEAFIQAGLWDEIRIITSSNLLQSGVKAPSIPQGVMPSRPIRYTAMDAVQTIIPAIRPNE